MQPGEERYLELAEKWINGSITAEEEAEFSAWYNEGVNNDVPLPPQFATSREELQRRIWGTVERRRKGLRRKRIVMLQRVAAAAIIILIVGTAYFMFNNDAVVSAPGETVVKRVADIAAPSIAKAVLTLDDGRQFYLDSADNGVITTTGTASINKLDEAKLSYEGQEQVSGRLVYNTLHVPRGSKVVNIILSDGSSVWLNAESSIRFPVAFGSDKRHVELTGEAYFEVAKDNKRPFAVQSGEYITEVLGTHFNINTYPDEMNGKVTLLEGSVKISRRNHSGSVLLRPAEQVVLNHKLEKVPTVDLDAVLAWKNGIFSFENTSIASIMRQISRWYDVDVEFADDVRDKHFTGSVGRGESVTEVLHLLELTDVIHFKIEGKTLKIYR